MKEVIKNEKKFNVEPSLEASSNFWDKLAEDKWEPHTFKVLDEYLKYDQIAKYAEFQHQPDEIVDQLAQKLVLPTLKNAQKYSVPILYVNPMNFNSSWSKKLRKNGAILFKLWDRPVNAIAIICEYVEYKNKVS